jgi:hypothetical protein
MPRQFTTPIQLPADPVNPLEATTKQFVDTGNTSLQRTKQPSAARWTDWRTRTVGTQVVTGTLGDDGTAFLVSPTATETATIANNRLEVSWPNSTGGALYLQQPLSTKVRRIGATFGFGPSANTTSAAVALATWDTPSPQAGATNAQIHLSMTASSATFGVVVNGSVINLANWPYFIPLAQDYTVYHAEVTLVGSTAFVALPDGQSQSVTDSRIGSINGTTACWEFFRDANTTTAPIAFQDTWASGSSQLGGATSYGNVARRINTYRSEVNTLLNAKAPLASPTFTGTVTVPMNPSNVTDAASKYYVDIGNYSMFGPLDHGFYAWSGDPNDASLAYTPPSNATLVMTMIKVDYSFNCTGVGIAIATGGATFTSSRNFVGLYPVGGNLLRQTADQATNWASAGITRFTPWSAGAIGLTSGFYYVALMTSATTRPSFAAKPNLVMNSGANTPATIGRSTFRAYLNSTTQTALPTTLPAATGFGNGQIWFGLY